MKLRDTIADKKKKKKVSDPAKRIKWAGLTLSLADFSDLNQWLAVWNYKKIAQSVRN